MDGNRQMESIRRNNKMRLSIDEKLLNKLVNYIGTKPFQEVFQLINEIQNDIKPIEEKPEQEVKEE